MRRARRGGSCAWLGRGMQRFTPLLERGRGGRALQVCNDTQSSLRWLRKGVRAHSRRMRSSSACSSAVGGGGPPLLLPGCELLALKAPVTALSGGRRKRL